MSNFVAVYDACVLHGACLRDLLLRLAMTDLFRARWTQQIQDEWRRALLRNRDNLTEEKLLRTQAMMNEAVPECLVTGYDGLIDGLTLPDPDDRHVLAAAIKCSAGAIVTYNTKDFPDELLEPLGMQAQHPDEFIAHVFDLNHGAVCAAVKEHRMSLRNPPRNVDELFEAYLRAELVTTVECLKDMRELL